MNNSQTALSVWHSTAFKYIIMTVCALILLGFLRKCAREFVDCRSQCKVTEVAENMAKGAANRFANYAASGLSNN